MKIVINGDIGSQGHGVIGHDSRNVTLFSSKICMDGGASKSFQTGK